VRRSLTTTNSDASAAYRTVYTSLMEPSATVDVASRSALRRNGGIGRRNVWMCAGSRASECQRTRLSWRCSTSCLWNQLTVPSLVQRY